MKAEPQAPVEVVRWKVKMFSIDGTALTFHMHTWDEITHASLFGRFRWYREDVTAITLDKRFALLPTAPTDLASWDLCHEPQQFLNLLRDPTMDPTDLEKQLGSPLAALQRVVDVWDHLKVRII